MDKAELLRQFREGRAALDALLDGLSDSDLTQPGVVGDWSIKDVLAHLTFWQGRAVDGVGQALGDYPQLEFPRVPDEEAMHRLNADAYQRSRNRPLREVQAEFNRTADLLLGLIQRLTGEQLNSTAAWTFDEPQWQAIANESFEHFEEHADDIRAWKAGRGSG